MQNNLYGLVLAGGNSKRMGTDKGALCYHGEKAQSEYLADLLAPFCEKVFFSIRENQKELSHLKSYPHIYDQYDNIGPMGGILSAFLKFPDKKILVLACDMPFVSTESIKFIIENHRDSTVATAFLNGEKNWPEPLFTIYNPEALTYFQNFYAKNITCPMKVLFNSPIHTLENPFGKILSNVNTPEEKRTLCEN